MTDVAQHPLHSLRLSPLFAGLTEDDLAHLAAQVERIEVSAGTLLFEEGSRGDRFFVILEGEVEITRAKGGVQVLLDVLGAGDFLSEMSLLENRPRSASARASRRSELLAVDPDGFRDLLARSPSAALTMLTTVTARLRSTQASLVEQGRLAGLGTLAAGLAHELNNPAAALVRSSKLMEDAVADFERCSAELARQPPGPEKEALKREVESQAFGTREAGPGPKGRFDSEATLEAWLLERGVDEGWSLASSLAGAGFDMAWAQHVEHRVGPTQLLPFLRWAAAGAELFSLLSEIQAGSKAISGIVESVRSYTHLGQGPVQSVNLAESISSTMAILKGRIGKRVTVLTAIPSTLPRIEARGGELGQVWTNLIHNALDAMGERGTLSIEAREEPGAVVVRIQDTGHGISNEVRSRIFDPFFTTKPEGKGTGLGLAITHGIVVNQHRGSIEVESQPGLTTFQVTLPIQATALPAPRLQAKTTPSGRTP